VTGALERLLHRARSRVGGAPVTGGAASIGARSRRVHLLVRLLYWWAFYQTLDVIGRGWEQWTDQDRIVGALWPISWVNALPAPWGVAFIGVIGLAGAGGAAVRPESRTARWIAAPAFLLVISLENSFGKVGHDQTALVVVLFVFVLLPSTGGGTARARRRRQMAELDVWWLAQACLLLGYTSSGIHKVVTGIAQAAAGEVGTFHPYALANHIGRRVANGDAGPIADVVVHWPLLGWPAYLAVVYVETVAVFVAFRPRLYRTWGTLLVCFHAGTLLLLGVDFIDTIAVLVLLLVVSPIDAGAGWRAQLADVPGVRTVRRLGRAVSPPSGRRPAGDEHPVPSGQIGAHVHVGQTGLGRQL
jgi:hypothetical protein